MIEGWKQMSSFPRDGTEVLVSGIGDFGQNTRFLGTASWSEQENDFIDSNGDVLWHVRLDCWSPTESDKQEKAL